MDNFSPMYHHYERWCLSQWEDWAGRHLSHNCHIQRSLWHGYTSFYPVETLPCGQAHHKHLNKVTCLSKFSKKKKVRNFQKEIQYDENYCLLSADGSCVTGHVEGYEYTLRWHWWERGDGVTEDTGIVITIWLSVQVRTSVSLTSQTLHSPQSRPQNDLISMISVQVRT